MADRSRQPDASGGRGWELTDDHGNRWTVEAEAFARSYHRRPDGRYAKHELVHAVQLTRGVRVTTTEGISAAQAGDWLLRDAEGAVWPVPDETFRARYRPVETPGWGVAPAVRR